MTAEDCASIMEHLPIIQALAEGNEIYFASFDWQGKFLGWKATKRVLLSPLKAGFYSVKPRYSCLKPGKPTPIAYPGQAAPLTKRQKRRLADYEVVK